MSSTIVKLSLLAFIPEILDRSLLNSQHKVVAQAVMGKPEQVDYECPIGQSVRTALRPQRLPFCHESVCLLWSLWPQPLSCDLAVGQHNSREPWASCRPDQQLQKQATYANYKVWPHTVTPQQESWMDTHSKYSMSDLVVCSGVQPPPSSRSCHRKRFPTDQIHEVSAHADACLQT